MTSSGGGGLKVPPTIGRWKLEAVLGDGSFGQVYLVSTAQEGSRRRGYAAMKVEERKEKRDDEILRMEVFVLLKLQSHHHFCTIYGRGQTPQFTYLVMTLLCESLMIIRQKLPARKFSKLTTLRIGFQLMNAYRGLHRAGYIHRDVKPDNLAPGFKRKDVIYVYDFGLSRQIYEDEARTKLRPARKKAPFRGTYRYCSVNAHKCGDQGRVDDIWGVLYCLIEFYKGRLPWAGIRPNESVTVKEETEDEDLFKDCPPSFLRIKNHLAPLGYAHEPDYASYGLWLVEDIQACENLQAPFEWQKPPAAVTAKEKKQHHHKKKEDSMEGETGSVETLDSDMSSRHIKDFDGVIEDTLDDLPPDDQYMVSRKKKPAAVAENNKDKKAAPTTTKQPPAKEDKKKPPAAEEGGKKKKR